MLKKTFLILIFISALYAEDNATYVGDTSCVECHSKEVQEWKGSHHDLSLIHI